jgi:hypothetical protein
MPIDDVIKEQEELFHKEYEKYYVGILSDRTLKMGNSWFTSFLRASMERAVEERDKEWLACMPSEMDRGFNEDKYDASYNNGWDRCVEEITDNLKSAGIIIKE